MCTIPYSSWRSQPNITRTPSRAESSSSATVPEISGMVASSRSQDTVNADYARVPFRIEFHAPSVMSPFSPGLPLELVDIDYELPTPQHKVVAASVSGHGPARGVDVDAAQFTFTSTTPASPLSPLASASAAVIKPMEKAKIVRG